VAEILGEAVVEGGGVDHDWMCRLPRWVKKWENEVGSVNWEVGKNQLHTHALHRGRRGFPSHFPIPTSHLTTHSLC
jgi:hypothetical protein